MFFGVDTVEVWRPVEGKNRDGDKVVAFHHEVVGCNFQPNALGTWPESDKSDGGQTKYGVKANSVLYVPEGTDIREGDYIIIGDRKHRVISPPLVHRFPSGWIPGIKVHTTEVLKW